MRRLKRGRDVRARFVESHLDKKLALQIRSLRGDQSQEEIEKKSGIKQQSLSRLESPYYGKATLTTLKKIAAVYDVGLLVEFVPFSQLMKRVSGTPYIERGYSPDTMNIPSFDEEMALQESLPVSPSAQVEQLTQMMKRFAGSQLDLDNTRQYFAVYYYGTTTNFDTKLWQHGLDAKVRFDLPDEQGTEPSSPLKPSPSISGPDLKNQIPIGGD
jgi:transcriptional regulator with XRE-family HTH domain